MNRDAYERLIAEDLEWLLQQPRTLERDHVESIVRRSADHEYNNPPALRSRSKKQKIEDQLRASDLTAQIVGRTDVEYGHHESLPRGEHVANTRKRTS